MALARHDAVFLAHEGEEVDPALSESHASLVWSQAANRLPTEQALLYTMVTGDWEA
jgi:ornithine carbamoyltransferase